MKRKMLFLSTTALLLAFAAGCTEENNPPPSYGCSCGALTEAGLCPPCKCDGSTTPAPDAGVAKPDSKPTTDTGTTSDKGKTTGDKSVPAPDTATPPTKDQAVPGKDTTVPPAKDTSPPAKDQTPPAKDKTVPKPDAPPPVKDAAPPPKDQGVPPTDGPQPYVFPAVPSPLPSGFLTASEWVFAIETGGKRYVYYCGSQHNDVKFWLYGHSVCHTGYTCPMVYEPATTATATINSKTVNCARAEVKHGNRAHPTKTNPATVLANWVPIWGAAGYKGLSSSGTTLWVDTTRVVTLP
ncbi:MAG: hypothetical protein ABII72_03560 [Parcubacteria group bacterium]